MDDIDAKAYIVRFIAGLDASVLAQTLLELAEDYPQVEQRIERLGLRSDPAALVSHFNQRLAWWDWDDRDVRYQDAAAFGRELDVWVAQVQREMLPQFPAETMALCAAFLELDRVVFERVDDDGGYVGGAFDVACKLWLAAAAAAGLSAVEIANRASELLAADHCGVRAPLNAALRS